MISKLKLRKECNRAFTINATDAQEYTDEKHALIDSLPIPEVKRITSTEDKDTVADVFKSGGVRAKRVELHKRATHMCYDVYPENVAARLRSKKGCEEALSRYFACKAEIIMAEVGKSCFVVRVPHKEEEVSSINMRTILEGLKEQNRFLPIVLGEDNTGDIQIRKLENLPHLLVAGATGSGKSSAIHAQIISMLLTNDYTRLQFVMIDVKKVEFSMYSSLTNYLATPIITDAEKAVKTLECLCKEMDNRFFLLEKEGLTDISQATDNNVGGKSMPHIVVIIDEFADLVAQDKGRVKKAVCRLAQKGRASGIHLIVSTQRPSTEVLPGDVKVNFENRMCFKVSTAVDSRVVLGITGADRISMRGEYMMHDRVKYLAPFIDREYCLKVVRALCKYKPPFTYTLSTHLGEELSMLTHDINRDSIVHGDAYEAIHGLYGDKNENYKYVINSEDDRSILYKLGRLAMDGRCIDERMIIKEIDCTMMDAIEYRYKLRYLRVIHTDGGFCAPSTVNNWLYSGRYKAEAGKHNYLDIRADMSVDTIRKAYADEYCDHVPNNVLYDPKKIKDMREGRKRRNIIVN